MSETLWLILMLVGAHALADYPLQGDFLARAKNRHAPIPGVPWFWALGAHAAIHAMLVAAVTQSLVCAFAEFVSHCLIDDAKCGSAHPHAFTIDQLGHLAIKGVYVVAIVGWGPLP